MDTQTFCQRLLVLLLRHVEVVDICGVVLAVVQLHDLGVDVGLQSAIVVGQVREGVLLPGHQAPQGGYQLGPASGREKAEGSSVTRCFSASAG